MKERNYQQEIKGVFPEQMHVKQCAQDLTEMCHGLAKQAGWWESTTKRDVPRLLMLCVSELAEAMEGDRKDLMDDHLPNRSMLG